MSRDWERFSAMSVMMPPALHQSQNSEPEKIPSESENIKFITKINKYMITQNMVCSFFALDWCDVPPSASQF